MRFPFQTPVQNDLKVCGTPPDMHVQALHETTFLIQYGPFQLRRTRSKIELGNDDPRILFTVDRTWVLRPLEPTPAPFSLVEWFQGSLYLMEIVSIVQSRATRISTGRLMVFDSIILQATCSYEALDDVRRVYNSCGIVIVSGDGRVSVSRYKNCSRFVVVMDCEGKYTVMS